MDSVYAAAEQSQANFSFSLTDPNLSVFKVLCPTVKPFLFDHGTALKFESTSCI